MICIPHQILLERSNQKEWDERVMWHVLRAGEVIQVFGGEIEGKRPFGRARRRWGIILKKEH